MKTSESILREYVQFSDVNGSETIELLPLTIIDCMEEYANLRKEGITETSEWINVNERLPKHKELCLFLLSNDEICHGKCHYFEHGDSELEIYGKGLSYAKSKYRNWELHNFDRSKKFEVTHWKLL